MNVERPHDIITEQQHRRLPPAKRARYRLITPRQHMELEDMTEDQRAVWLLSQPGRTDADWQRIKRAAVKRVRKRRAKA